MTQNCSCAPVTVVSITRTVPLPQGQPPEALARYPVRVVDGKVEVGNVPQSRSQPMTWYEVHQKYPWLA